MSLINQKSPLFLRHSLFWLAYAALLISLLSYFIPLSQAIPRALANVGFHAGLTYLNLQWLFPKYLLKKRYTIYFIWSMIGVFFFSACHFFIFSPIVEGFAPDVDPEVRYFGRTLTSMIAVYLISILYAFVIDFLQREKREARVQSKQLESELKFLKSQLNPHFLFNTLNNVYSLCHLKDEKAAPMVMKLSELMRYMLYDCQSPTVSLEKEIQFLQSFISLQKLKTDWEQQIDFSVRGIVQGHRVAPLLFLPFFENLSKHSDLDMNPKAWVKITLVTDKENSIQFEMKNTIRKLPNTQMEKSGIGLSNLQKRLELVYPNKHELIREEEGGIFRVKLILKLD